MHEIVSGIRHELQKTREYIMTTGKGKKTLFHLPLDHCPSMTLFKKATFNEASFNFMNSTR